MSAFFIYVTGWQSVPHTDIMVLSYSVTIRQLTLKSHIHVNYTNK